MIVSMNTIAKLPRWLSGGVLALAMGLLPFGIAYGQDYDAVERRLGAAVADGEITLSQAQTMMRALRATSEDQELEKLKAGIEERLRHHGEELRKQLAAGEITKEEMEARFKAKRREMWGHYREAEMKRHHREREHGEADGNAPRDAYMHRIREIEEAMKSGKISREEGTRAIEETKRRLEEATRDGQETSRTSSRKDDARTGMKTLGVEPRFVPEEEYNRVEADLKRQVAAGWRERIRSQPAEGKTTG